jgi:hypothetical protein
MKNVKTDWAPVANRVIRNEVEALPLVQREHFEERAGILQHDAGMECAAAEELALQQTKDLFQIA